MRLFLIALFIKKPSPYEEEKSNNEVDSGQDKTKVGNAFSSESGDLIMSDPNSIYGYTTTEDDRFNEIGQIRSNKKLPFI